VQGIPAVKAFRNGEVVAEFVGARPPDAVAAFFDELTGPTAIERVVAELTETGELPGVVVALTRDDHEQALSCSSIEAIVGADGEERERLLALTVGLFGELGQEHPTTVRYCRRLAADLY
jgi:thioredoxin-like negative regulator of GroEL